MTNNQIIKLIERWQVESQKSCRGIYVSSFSLSPESNGFVLEIELFEDTDTQTAYYRGKTVSETFSNAVIDINNRIETLKNILDNDSYKEYL